MSGPGGAACAGVQDFCHRLCDVTVHLVGGASRVYCNQPLALCAQELSRVQEAGSDLRQRRQTIIPLGNPTAGGKTRGAYLRRRIEEHGEIRRRRMGVDGEQPVKPNGCALIGQRREQIAIADNERACLQVGQYLRPHMIETVGGKQERQDRFIHGRFAAAIGVWIKSVLQDTSQQPANRAVTRLRGEICAPALRLSPLPQQARLRCLAGTVEAFDNNKTAIRLPRMSAFSW